MRFEFSTYHFVLIAEEETTSTTTTEEITTTQDITTPPGCVQDECAKYSHDKPWCLEVGCFWDKSSAPTCHCDPFCNLDYCFGKGKRKCTDPNNLCIWDENNKVCGCGETTTSSTPGIIDCAAAIPYENSDGEFVCDGLCPGDNGGGPGCEPTEDELACTCPPPCKLDIVKTCFVEEAPASFGKCKGKIRNLQLQWNGDAPAFVEPVTQGLAVDPPPNVEVPNGAVVTLTPTGSTFDGNDQEIRIIQGGSEIGTSIFHMSCSDKDMNDPEDCPNDQGGWKGGTINTWKLARLEDKNGNSFVCPGVLPGPPAVGGDTTCTIYGDKPNCKWFKPKKITWLFTGGECDDSTIDEDHDDFECLGRVDGGSSIEVRDKRGSLIASVEPNKEFSINLKDMKSCSIGNAFGTQRFKFHTSCSQPLSVGDQAGALRLVAFDDNRGSKVRYTYTVTNSGPEAAFVTSVDDDKLGEILEQPAVPLPPNESIQFTKEVALSTTTMNVAEVTGESADGTVCDTGGPSNSVLVQVIPKGSSGSKSGSKSDTKTRSKVGSKSR